MARLDNINKIKTEGKNTKKLEPLRRDVNRKIITKANEGNIVMPKRDGRNGVKSLRAFAETLCSSWFLYEVFMPLFLIVALLLPLLIEDIKEAFWYILGKGALFLFSTIISINLFKAIRRARYFSEKLSCKIGLSSEWEVRILSVILLFVTIYAMNVYQTYGSRLLDQSSSDKFVCQIWTLIGLGASTAATILYWTALKRIGRSLRSI